MLDPAVISRMVEEHVYKSVNDQLLEVFSSNDWLQPIEQKIVKYTQDRILGKFSNSSAMPEIVDAVKVSVRDLFEQNQIPGIDTFVDPQRIQQAVDQAVEKTVLSAIENLSQNKVWLEKIEQAVNQAMIQRTLSALNGIDVRSVISQRVDEGLKTIMETRSSGIQDRASQCELTVLDQHVVVENNFTVRNVDVVDALTVKNLSVKGSINTDNHSWDELKNHIARRTLDQINKEWRTQLVNEVKENIQKNGINFSDVQVDGEKIVSNGQLSKTIRESSLQSVGTLRGLDVVGDVRLNDTLNVNNKRVGINTVNPEMALGLWDEEVSLIAGKLKADTAYVGTSRAQALSLGVNRDPAVTIDTAGLTAIKKLRVGLHQFSHDNSLPGYSGTKGDIVFNANPEVGNNVLGWQCLGGHRWKVLRLVE
jgi:hypothetical protein